MATRHTLDVLKIQDGRQNCCRTAPNLRSTKANWVPSGHPAKIPLKLRTITNKCKSRRANRHYKVSLMSQNNYVRDLRETLITVKFVKYITATRHLSKQTLLHTLDTLSTFPYVFVIKRIIWFHKFNKIYDVFRQLFFIIMTIGVSLVSCSVWTLH